MKGSTCNFLKRSPCVLLCPCFPCLAFQNCFWAEYLFMGHTLKRQSGGEGGRQAFRSHSVSQVKCHLWVSMWGNSPFLRWLVLHPPEPVASFKKNVQVCLKPQYCVKQQSHNQPWAREREREKPRTSVTSTFPHKPLNFLGGLARFPASGWTTHLSSTSLQRRGQVNQSRPHNWTFIQ